MTWWQILAEVAWLFLYAIGIAGVFAIAHEVYLGIRPWFLRRRRRRQWRDARPTHPIISRD